MADQDMSNGVYGDDISDEYQWPQIYIFPFVLTIFFFSLLLNNLQSVFIS